MPGASRWVKPDAMHLTLKFLGELPEDKVGSVKAILVSIAGARRPFPLRLKGTGTFPPGGGTRARILWAGIEEAPGLMELQAALESELEKAGFPARRQGLSPPSDLGARQIRAGTRAGPPRARALPGSRSRRDDGCPSHLLRERSRPLRAGAQGRWPKRGSNEGPVRPPVLSRRGDPDGLPRLQAERTEGYPRARQSEHRGDERHAAQGLEACGPRRRRRRPQGIPPVVPRVASLRRSAPGPRRRLLAVVGHCYPVYIGFRGGKGVATTVGAAAAVGPVPLLLCAVVFVGRRRSDAICVPRLDPRGHGIPRPGPDPRQGRGNGPLGARDRGARRFPASRQHRPAPRRPERKLGEKVP